MDATPPSPQRTTSVLATVSLIFGILGWRFLPLLRSVVAIVTGHLARAEIRRDPDRLQGNGLAVSGLFLGYAAIVVGILLLMTFVLFFGGLYWVGANQ